MIYIDDNTPDYIFAVATVELAEHLTHSPYLVPAILILVSKLEEVTLLAEIFIYNFMLILLYRPQENVFRILKRVNEV